MKKIIALLLACMMVVGLFAACAACDMPALIHINTTLEKGYDLLLEKPVAQTAKECAVKAVARTCCINTFKLVNI